MKMILRILLALAVPLAFSDQLNELRGRRDLSPYDMHKWMKFRTLLPLPAYDQGDVAQGPCCPSATPTAREGDPCGFINGV